MEKSITTSRSSKTLALGKVVASKRDSRVCSQNVNLLDLSTVQPILV